MDSNTNRSYRIRTKVGDKDGVLKVDMPLVQTYDTFEILSLKLNQRNQYNYYDSSYGVICGRVLANENFGIPNAKISIFIPVEENADLNERILYNFSSVRDTNFDNVRYNLLPDYVDSACHQDVGTFPNKRLVLDNNDIIEIFDKYYKYTTTTNQSGDYMLFGVPTGSQNIHVDLDLSDIGTLSQRPRDMVHKGYNINQFDSPNKFKTSTNLNSLSQIYSQDKGVYCYPYWGNSNNDNEGGTSHIAITRCDIKIDYKFEPTAIFIGSIVTDKGSNAIGKNCTGTDTVGKMADLATGEGTIEMIRKTVDNKVEQFQIQGDRLIDGDGVWCYQIPMNLDYVMTDEFGNMVPTDDPSKGIATRTRVRFRISMDENPNDATARKRCRFLVPNNPSYVLKEDYPEFHRVKEADYEFGSSTREESYCDMFWNNVYTVKSYIPRLQKNNNTTNRKHTGIKMINHYGDNNPMPFNSLSIKLGFTFRLICIITKIIIYLIAFLNMVLGTIMLPFCTICSILSGLGKIPLIGFVFKLLAKPFCAIVFSCIEVSSEFCDDGINKKTYYPGCWGCQWTETKKRHNDKQNTIINPEERTIAENPQFTNIEDSTLVTCIENSLAQDNEATSFNFQNDWVNGVLYAPLWYRKIKKKRSFLFGLIKRRAKDEWCRADANFNLLLYQACTLKKTKSSEKITSPVTGISYDVPGKEDDGCSGKMKCGENKTTIKVDCGLVTTKETMLGETVYYYKALNYNYEQALKRNGDGVILLFATDIVLLGSLNDCDLNGIPQFFKNLDSTTYNLPTDILFTDTVIQLDADGNVIVNANNEIVYDQFTEATGCDWGNLNSYDECGKQGKGTDGGLFYGIGCSSTEMINKSCINLPRICEYGVSLDEAKEVVNLATLSGTENDSAFERLTPDGFISFDELYNVDERSMFATLNGNRLRTRLNKKNGLKEYDLRYLYVDNFDGLLEEPMKGISGNCNYKNNYNLEKFSRDYYMFRMGTEPFYYDGETMKLARYENSFYFYFGLKMGKTAIDKFNSQFYSQCEDTSNITSPIKIETKANSWCSDIYLGENEDNVGNNPDGYVYLNVANVDKPCSMIIRSLSNSNIEYTIDEITDSINVIFFGSEEDYKKVYTTEDLDDVQMYNMIFPNGKYEYIITDVDGKIISDKFELKGRYLSFIYEKQDFKIPNNQKFNELGVTKYEDVINNIIKSKENQERYGGIITIKSIINGEDTANRYRVTINPTNPDNFVYLDKKYGNISFIVNIDENGKIVSMDNVSPFAILETVEGENCIIIAVPQGNENYNITITQLCDIDGIGNDIDSNNESTITVMINDPMPFKLYINDVDVSVLKKDKFNTGWKEDTLKNNQLGTYINIKNVEGWLQLSDERNYDFSKLDGWEEASEEERNTMKAEFISKVKETFWITCPSSYKDLIFTVSTNHLPVEFHILGNEEEIDEDKSYTGKLINESRLHAFEDTVSNIDSIYMPTITTVDNESYGYDHGTDAQNGKICFGYDRINGYSEDDNKYKNTSNGNGTWFKKPYGIWIKDTSGGILPYDGEEEKYFYFHLIDKTLRFNILSWSYINSLPYFNLNEEDERNGKSVTMNGFVCGYIYNGIYPLSITFNNKEYSFDTLNSEDEMPTKRILMNKPEVEEGVNTEDMMIYQNYKFENSVGNIQYIEVPNRKTSITIDDSGSCTVFETIYGTMKLTLGNESLNDCKNNRQTLKLNVVNGDDNNDNIICVIKENEHPYPINHIENGKFICSSYNDYDILKYDMTASKLKDTSDRNFIGMDKDDNDNLIERQGWSQSGDFECSGINYPIYAVGVTSNNCRTLSPVYDYRTVSAKIIVTTSDEGEKIVSIKLGNINYYIKYYLFNVELNIGLGSPVNATKSIDVNSLEISTENKIPMSLNTNMQADNIFYEQDGDKYILYSFKPSFSMINDSVSPSGRIVTENAFIGYKFPSDIDVDGNIIWKKFVYIDDKIEIEDSSEEEDLLLFTAGDYSFEYEIIINEITGETAKRYQNISFKMYEMLYETDEDPTLKHYEKNIDFVISDQQYIQMQALNNVIFRNKLIELTNLYITDFTGLRHLVKVNYG